MYKSAVEVKDAVKRWSTLTLQREFRVVKSGKIIGRSNLLWITLVYLSSWMQDIVICHSVLWPARCLLRLWKILLLNLSPLSWQLRRNLYGKAYMAKNKVMEMWWGTYEASYDNLP
jgi:hypothetical protein